MQPLRCCYLLLEESLSRCRSEATGHRRTAKVLGLLASGLVCLSALPLTSGARITVSETGDVLVGPPKIIDGDTLVVYFSSVSQPYSF